MDTLTPARLNSMKYERVCIKDKNKEAGLEELSTILENVGRLMSRAFWDTASESAAFNPWVWGEGNEEYHEVLKEASAEDRIATLGYMMRCDAVMYKAVCGEDVVGAVVMIKLTSKFHIPEALGSTEEVEKERPVRLASTTNEEWRKKVEAWAINTVRDRSLTRTLRQSINYHFDTYKDLWELSLLCVDEAYRRRGVAKNLVDRALSEVKSGHCVVLTAEPALPKYYERFGFRFTEHKKYQYMAVSEREGDSLKFPIMTMQKP